MIRKLFLSALAVVMLFSLTACTGKICGKKYNDLNCDGKYNSTEPGLQGWTIIFTNTQTGVITTAITNPNGDYCKKLSPGNYTVAEDLQSDWIQTIPGGAGTYTVTLGSHQTINNINFGNCNRSSVCNCSSWEPAVITWDGASPETQTINCGGGCFINWMWTGTPITITSSVNCVPTSCIATYHWSVTKISGDPEGPWSGNGLPVSFAPTKPGSFEVVLYASCDGASCPPCTVDIRIGEMQTTHEHTPTPTYTSTTRCNCSSWEPVVITWDGVSPETQTINCGVEYSISWMWSGTDITVASSVNCVPTNCNATYHWSVTKISGNPEGPWSGTGLPVSFAPTKPGIFEVVLYASCDGESCPPCAVKIRTNEMPTQHTRTPTRTPTTSACNCSKWSEVTITWNNSAGIQETKCGGNVSIPWIQDSWVFINSGISCPSDLQRCTATYNWSIWKSGVKVCDGAGLPPFKLEENGHIASQGLYMVVLNASCDGTSCPPCTIYVNISG